MDANLCPGLDESRPNAAHEDYERKSTQAEKDRARQGEL